MATPSFLTGVSGTRGAHCLTHCSSLLFPPNADSTHSSAPHAGATAGRGAAFVKVSPSNAASQHGSTAAATGDADPMKGISTAPIVRRSAAAGFGCMVIQRLYFYSPAADRDAQRPHGCSAAVSECVGVTAPRQRPLLSALT